MIYFIRHGETDYNKDGRFQGHLDIPLNKIGLNQAKTALENSKSLHFDIIYYSPLSRAKQTAAIINSFHKAQFISDDRLKELFFGSLQGKTYNKLSASEQSLAFTNPEKFGGESLIDFCNRVNSFYQEIENSSKNILIVAHGGVYRALYKIIHNINGFEFNIKPLPNATLELIKN